MGVNNLNNPKTFDTPQKNNAKCIKYMNTNGKVGPSSTSKLQILVQIAAEMVKIYKRAWQLMESDQGGYLESP